MRDLFRCLSEHSSQMLQAIAAAWGLPAHLAEPREPHEAAMALGAAMLAEGALERVLAALSPAASEALQAIVAEGGVLPSHRLAMAYGALRRLGPARVARERPWEQPENALEELYYRGLVYRAYGQHGAYLGELLLVPAELLERLPPAEPNTLDLPAVDAPPHVLADGAALAEDLLAVLVHLRQTESRAVADEVLPLRELDLGERLLGGRTPERLRLMQRLLLRLGLVAPAQGLWQPSARAREWLESPDSERRRALFAAWLHDPQHDELAALEGVRLEGGSLPTDLRAARVALAQFLARLPQQRWLGLDDVVATLRRWRPDYLRPDGNYQSWFVRDATDGHLLEDADLWERVEGGLARHLLTGALRWLGVAEVGIAAPESAVRAVRITVEGAAWLAEAAAAREPGTTDRPAVERAPTPPRAQVHGDMSVVVPLAESAYLRYQLERLAEWVGQDENEARYRLTAESIWRGQNAGIAAEQILRFLQRITGDRVPANVSRALGEWGCRFGRVLMRRAIVLRTADEATMEALRADADVAAMLGESLGPTACLVPEERVKVLTRALKALGIWPHVRL